MLNNKFNPEIKNVLYELKLKSQKINIIVRKFQFKNFLI